MLPTERSAQVEVRSREDLRDWLRANHGQEESVWVVRWMKAPGRPYLSRLEVLDEVLCWGWIDGIARKLDGERTMQLLSPRRHQRWTRTYRDRAARLIAEGLMQELGFRAIAEAKARETWEAMPDVDALLVPDDLLAALEVMPPARERFEGSAPSYRRNVLRWIALAKTPPTREKRVRAAAEAAAENRRLPQM
jgi:uncharacterized protein YdeI (YjbR/CyaY-like superfamily)